MFKDREIRVRLARTTDDTTAPEREYKPLLTEIEIDLIENYVKKTALFLAGMVVLVKATDAACQIAIHHGTKS